MIRAVVLDVGETLLDDTAEWARWASWIDVPTHTFSAVLGAVTVAGRNNAETFQYFRPGFDLAAERQRREDAGVGELIEEKDLYPDVRPALTALRDTGVWVGVAGNQTTRAAELLRDLDLPVDAIATSGEWGVAKPDPAFFDRVADFAPGTGGEIAYVGDHRDNDIVPAHAAGLRSVLIRRGPWGYLWADDPAVRANADLVIDSLAELPALLPQLG
jgi:HAD superfamily hydrolase (TIGR01549 family)